jgi:hypothetical protein
MMDHRRFIQRAASSLPSTRCRLASAVVASLSTWKLASGLLEKL